MQNQSTVDETQAENVARTKKRLAALWAPDNEELAEALVLAFDEMEAELASKPTVKSLAAKPGWPKIQRGEKVVFKDHWCTVVAFTAKGVELGIGEPTAALRKRTAKAGERILQKITKQRRKQKGVHQRQRKRYRDRRRKLEVENGDHPKTNQRHGAA